MRPCGWAGHAPRSCTTASKPLTRPPVRLRVIRRSAGVASGMMRRRAVSAARKLSPHLAPATSKPAEPTTSASAWPFRGCALFGPYRTLVAGIPRSEVRGAETMSSACVRTSPLLAPSSLMAPIDWKELRLYSQAPPRPVHAELTGGVPTRAVFPSPPHLGTCDVQLQAPTRLCSPGIKGGYARDARRQCAQTDGGCFCA